MIPFRFGPADLALFGALHPAEGESAKLGVLLCNPFGQEAIRIHRFYRVLADRLAQAGIPCMRFDYFGTGESDGDDLDGSLPRWCQDIRLAHQELQRRIPCQRVAWVGARLGATLAVMASSGDVPGPHPDALVLWEPIMDGPRYLQTLARDHVAAVASPYRPAVAQAAEQPRGEALGFAMSEHLIQQMAHIDLATQGQTSARHLTIVAKSSDARMKAWLKQYKQAGGDGRALPLTVPFEWTSEEAMNTALVPPAALQLLSKVLEGAAA